MILSLDDRKVTSIGVSTPLRQAVDQVIRQLSDEDRTVFEANLARLDGDAARLASLVDRVIAQAAQTNALSRACVDVLSVAPMLAAPHLSMLTRIVENGMSSLATRLSSEHMPAHWGAIDAANLTAFLLGRLLSGGVTEASVVESALKLLHLVPSTAEYFTFTSSITPDLKSAVYAALNDLLRGAHRSSQLSRRRQQFSGLRGVTKRLVQGGVAEVSREWISTVATLAGGDDIDLATYATWILTEWVGRGAATQGEDVIAATVGPALRAAALDPRTLVRARGTRGIQLMLVRPQFQSDDAENRRLIERLGQDRTVAVRCALAGTGAMLPF